MIDTSNTETGVPPSYLAGQSIHFVGLFLLLLAIGIAWRISGSPTPTLFWCAVSTPIFHQCFVWLTWRSKLNNSVPSIPYEFPIYVIVFFVLLIGRFVSLGALAWVDRESLQLSFPIRAFMTTILAAPGLYAGYSVFRYFGFARASGADHFDPRYRKMPLVNKGIFRFTNNGMYLYAFLLFWAIAFAANSTSAIVVAAFSHAYIWIHYFATEKPDMIYLYRNITHVSDS